MYDSCELQSRRKFFGEWGIEEPSEGREGTSHLLRRDSACAWPWATGRDAPLCWHDGIMQDFLAANDGNTLAQGVGAGIMISVTGKLRSGLSRGGGSGSSSPVSALVLRSFLPCGPAYPQGGTLQ